MTLKKALLATSAGMIAMMAAAPSFAQDTAVDEVIVTGIRASLQAAIEQKRNADMIQEVVTAQDIGKFPDKNIADSLSRVTGVNVVTGSAAAGGFGENERVSIRGTDPNLNLTLMNGHNLATGDWFVLDQQNGGRSFNYSMLPAELVGTLEVYKSSQADLPEGGVGGTVNVHTRKPLDLPSMTFNATAQGVYAQRADKFDPQVSALASWKDDTGSFGVLVAGFYQKRHLRRDGQEILGYNEITNFRGTGQTVLAPALIGNAYFQQTRVRKGGNIVAQWKPTEKLELELSGLYTRMDADNVNANNMAWVSRLLNTNSTVGSPDDALASYTIANGVLTSATWRPTTASGGLVQGRVQDDIFREAYSSTWVVNLDGKYEVNDNLTLSGQIGYTEGKGVTKDTYAWETLWNTGMSYTLGSPITSVTYTGMPSDPTAPAYLNNLYSWSWGGRQVSPDEEFYAKGDAEWLLDNGVFQSLNFGARFTDHTREGNYTAYSWAGNTSGTTPGLGAVYDGDSTPSNYGSGLGGLQGYTISDMGKVRAYLDGNNGGRQFAFYPPQSFSVQEKTSALYGMVKLKGERWRGNVGVRAVHTDTDTTQYSSTAPNPTITNQFGSWGEVNNSRDYWDVLPSANLTVEATDDVLLRFSAAKVMARPGYAQLASSLSLNELALTGTAGGNPDLDPFRAWQFNAVGEWYYAPEALLSVGVFYLDIKSYITSQTFTAFYRTQQNPQGANFRITGPVNGGGGSNRGFEASLQQPIGAGFGFIANYTYSDAETDLGKPIDGSSKNTYNLTGYFENDLISARVAYNFRSKFKSGVDRGTDMWQDDISSLDASLIVNLTENVALSFDAQNLTREKLVYYVGDPSVPRAIYDNGRVFYAGARFKF